MHKSKSWKLFSFEPTFIWKVGSSTAQFLIILFFHRKPFFTCPEFDCLNVQQYCWETECKNCHSWYVLFFALIEKEGSKVLFQERVLFTNFFTILFYDMFYYFHLSDENECQDFPFLCFLVLVRDIHAECSKQFQLCFFGSTETAKQKQNMLLLRFFSTCHGHIF